MERTDFVTSREEVIKNIQTLYDYAKSEDKELREWAQERYAKGKWFVLEKIENQLCFAPIRFAGYRNNTRQKHEENERRGGAARTQVEKKQDLYKPELENRGSILVQFENFLTLLGFPKKYKKNVQFYIPRGVESISDLGIPISVDKNMATMNKNLNQYDSYIELLKSNKNLILTGAPGTGKTYLAKEIAKRLIVGSDSTSILLDDFESKIKAYLKVWLQIDSATGKEKYLIKKSKFSDKIHLKGDKNKGYDISFKEIENAYKRKLWEGGQKNGHDPYSAAAAKFIFEQESSHSGIKEVQNDDATSISDHIEFVQFHPSYDYTDFVEGLRPTSSPDANGNIGFKREDGIFKAFCARALNNPEKNFVFIIDEINRGEISKIFGELFFSIDPGYRGEKGRVDTQYKNLIDETDPFHDGFYVPENVYVIGTMNDIDRSVESMDFAMRRRFAWQEIKASENTGMLNELGDMKDEVCRKMQWLNEAIEKIEGLGSAYHIGGAYFRKLEQYLNEKKDNPKEAYKKLWENHLKGVLFEYLRGMADADTKLNSLRKAYFDEKDEANQPE